MLNFQRALPHRAWVLSFSLVLAGLGPAAAAPAVAAAPTFTVNSLADIAASGNLANGPCETAPGSGVCTLRAAVMKANHFPGGGVTIVIPANALAYQITIPQVIAVYGEADGDFNLNANMTILGGGAAGTTVQGNRLDRLFNISSTATVGIGGLTLRDGYDDENGRGGGAILNLGHLSLSHSVLVSDTSQVFGGAVYNTGVMSIADTLIDASKALGSGGAIRNTGVLTLDTSAVSHNQALGGAGGGILNSGALTITRSTLWGNQALDYQGGGIDNTGTLMLYDSTLSNNLTTTGGGTLVFGGGGLYNGGTANVIFSTIAGNLADNFTPDGANAGGGIFNATNKTVNLRASLLAWNYAGAVPNDCQGNVINSGDYNYLQTTNSCFLTGAQGGNHTGGDPGLEALADNGGPVTGSGQAPPTRLLRTGSPALNAIPSGQCFDLLGAPLTFDQRGALRPAAGACDMGAVEGSDSPGLLLTNLVRNGDAEQSAGSPNKTPAGLPYWTATTDINGLPTAVTYFGYWPASLGYLTPTVPGPAERGFSFLSGGNQTNIGLLTQTVDVSSQAGAIDASNLNYDFSGYFGGSGAIDDRASAKLAFYDALDNAITSAPIGNFSAGDRGSQTGLLFAADQGLLPSGTRRIEIDLYFVRSTGGDNTAFADDLVLRLSYPNNLFLPLTRR